MDTKIIKIIFVGGLDNRTDDLNLEQQTKLVIEGYGDNVISFRYNAGTTQILKEIENNPDSPILLFSAGCAKSKEIATKLKELNRKLDLLHIVEPYTCSENTKTIVEYAIKLGVPSSNVFKGSTDCTGANITGATSNKELGKEIGIDYITFHWDAVKIVSSFIKSKFPKEEIKEEEKKELKTYELTLKIDENGKITNDKLGTLKIIEKLEDSFLSGFDFGDEEVDLSLLDEEFTEVDFVGEYEGCFSIELREESGRVSKDLQGKTIDPSNASVVIPPADPNVIPGVWDLDTIGGSYKTNTGEAIQLCQIDGSLVNIKIAPAYFDMREAAKRDGIELIIASAFRAPYDEINTKSKSGASVRASSQKFLYDGWINKKPNFNLAAEPGKSNHGNGIALDISTGGSSQKRYAGLKSEGSIYEWLVKNSWRFGFIRTVANEEWHYDYRPDIASKGPYAHLPAKDQGKVNTKFYNKKENGEYWGLDEIKISDITPST